MKQKFKNISERIGIELNNQQVPKNLLQLSYFILNFYGYPLRMRSEQTHPWNWSCSQFNKAKKQCTAHRIEIEKLCTNGMTTSQKFPEI